MGRGTVVGRMRLGQYRVHHSDAEGPTIHPLCFEVSRHQQCTSGSLSAIDHLPLKKGGNYAGRLETGPQPFSFKRLSRPYRLLPNLRFLKLFRIPLCMGVVRDVLPSSIASEQTTSTLAE